jgi:hypothetical protein
MFNQAIMSWWGTGFVDSVFKKCLAFIDHRTGNFFTKGLIQANDLNIDHDAIIDNKLTTEYLDVNQGVNATNASITNATITNAYLTNLNVSNLQQMPCYIAGYVIGKNGTGFHPIICTVANTSNNYLNFNTTSGYLGLTNTDYGFILFPKYKLQAYRDPNFGRPYATLYDNTNGTNPIYWQENIGDIGSWKLYYSNTEFKITGIST